MLDYMKIEELTLLYRDADFIYRFSEICNRRKPASVYDFSLCICKTSGRNSGMGFWDYQFQNILKLFKVDQRLPALIHKEYRKDRTRVIRILTYLKTSLGIIYGVLV